MSGSSEKVREVWQEFFDWFFSEPRVPANQLDWAMMKGLHPDTISRWKRHPEFKRLWQARAEENNLAPDRVQAVLDTLYRAATSGDGDVRAAKEYLNYAKALAPKREFRAEDVEDLTDEQLEAELAKAGLL